MDVTQYEIRIMSMPGKINSFIGLIAAGLLSLFGKSPAKPTTEDLNRAEFKTSTQRLGVRFSEKIRDIFRFKWIRAFKKTNTSPNCHSERSEESRRLR